MSLLKNASIVSFWTLVSRILGLMRETLFAAALATSSAADAFLSALRLPNTLRTIFAEGALHATFLPAYTKEQNISQKNAQIFAGQILSILLVTISTITIIAITFMPQVMALFAYGFLDDPEKFAQTVTLARIVFPYIILMVLVSLMTSINNAHQRFVAGSAVPVFLNLSLIAVLVLFFFDFIQQDLTLALASGVLIAGFLQFFFLIIVLKNNHLLPALRMPFGNPAITTTVLTFFPAALSASVYHVNGVINHVLATTLENGAVSFLYYAERIHQLPLAVIGLAIATALLPQLRQDCNQSALNSPSNQAFDGALIIIIPATFGMVAIAPDIILTIYQHGAFSPRDAVLTAQTLSALAIGLPPLVLIRVTAAIFFSRQNTKTVAVIAIITAAVNFALALALMQKFSFVGLALAASASSWANLVLSLIALHFYNYWKISRYQLVRIIIYTVCALIMILVLVLHSHFFNFEQLLILPTIFRVLILLAKICFSVALYSLLLLVICRFLPSPYKPLFLSRNLSL